MVKKACPKCLLLTEEDKCPRCEAKASKLWQGYLIVLDYQRSHIAEKMGINANGKYALKVR
jgi:DNA-directed RNA polymerase subunit E"